MLENSPKPIDRFKLKDIHTVHIDPALPAQARMESFVAQIGDPYCYLDGGIVVSIGYADTNVTLHERLKAYVCGLG